MIIAVGSENPIKHEAVHSAFQRLWPQETFKLVGVEVDSGVPEQPLSDDEMITGAKKRAQVALRRVKGAQYGVGLEGGLCQIKGDWFGRSWIAVVDTKKRLGLGASATVRVPKEMMQLVHEGKNMSEVCEVLYGIKDIGRKEGYYGLLTNNQITRISGYTEGVIMALSAFVHPVMRKKQA